MTDDTALEDSRLLYGDCDTLHEPDFIAYGDSIRLWVAPKEGKAVTLLADQLFSPALLLAEAIELGKLPIGPGATVVELGAGTALPSLVAAARGQPSLVSITDYPDSFLMESLRKNVDGNRASFAPKCRVECIGYEWGRDVDPLLKLLPEPDQSGYDVVILSDLLHFKASHEDLVSSARQLLKRSSTARLYVAAGKYTSPEVCADFFRQMRVAGIDWQAGENDGVWRGERQVGIWSSEDLDARKANVNWWIGHWKSLEL